MSRRRRSAVAEPPAAEAAADRLRPFWLGSLTALFVAMPIIPTETVLLGGSVAVVLLLWWILLLGWCVSGIACGQLRVNLGVTNWAVIAFLIWHSISAIVMAWQGHPRASYNMLWLWVSFGFAFFLARQLIVTAAERRAVVTAMIALSVSLSILGYYQYFVELPATRAAYEKDPEKVLSAASIDAPPGTPQRKLFEDRLYSTEPLGPFALTNSLAGFLSPWLIIALGIGFTQRKSAAASSRVRTGLVAAGILILGCWILTKSRTAWLATMLGIGLLVVYGRRAGWRPDGRIVAAAGATAVVLLFLAAVIGGLDRLVVLESSKSLLYRLQYWHATAALIGDHPWFGCGPGNFQQYYTAYKLPEASETIAEPHNFLLEIWATAGTPALIGLLAILAAVIWERWRADKDLGAPAAESANAPSKFQADLGSVRSIYWGALLGAILGYVVCGALEEYSPSPGLLVGVIFAVAIVVLLDPWVADGHLPTPVLSIAVVVMLINLLAAGGISFAGVSQSLWLLIALLLHRGDLRGAATHEPILGRWPAAALTAGFIVLLVAFHRTAYSPITKSQTYLIEANSRRLIGRSEQALGALQQAATADPRSPEPWRQMEELTNQLWLQTEQPSLEAEFRKATEEHLARNSKSSHAHMMAGHHWFVAYHHFKNRDYLDRAIASYRIAVNRYPNYNLGHAQLAWALHLAADPAAIEEAEEALRLDAINPHAEQKLSQQKIFDPTDGSASESGTKPLSAEQKLLELRKR